MPAFIFQHCITMEKRGFFLPRFALFRNRFCFENNKRTETGERKFRKTNKNKNNKKVIEILEDRKEETQRKE